MRLLLLILLAASFAMAGCGGDDGGGEKGGEEGRPATLTVGVIPVSNVGSLYLGIEKGFFRKEKLTIKPRLSEGGAEVIPAVISGGTQIGYSNIASLFIAADKGLPIQIVANPGGGEAERGKTKDILAKVFVSKDSPIREPRDLAGKTIAVNTLNNILDITTKGALEKRGVEPDSVKFLEIPFPEMLPALEAGRVDAAFLVPPFAQGAAAAGHRTILRPFYEIEPGLVSTGYFAARKWAEQNPDVVKRFARAMKRSLVYAGDHPDELRRVLPKFTKIPKQIVPKIPLGQIDAPLDQRSLDLLGELMVKYKAIEKEPNLDQLVREGTLTE